MRTLPALVLVFGAASVASAQQQHANWYFGYGAGSSFNGSEPVSLEGNPFVTDEGTASISDANGQLLFFSNGEVVYDRTLAPMPNGTGLAGHYSAAQSALIVPFVGDPSSYYLFTVPAQVGAWSGLYSGLSYSVVDMDLNGGLGDVVEKNTELQDQVTEHLAAVRHANGRDAWVVVHGWGTNTFYAYLVTCTGVQGPVVSQAGEPFLQDEWGSNYPAIGCMDIAAQGDRLAINHAVFETVNGASRLEILAFNNATGEVGGGISIERGGTPDTDLRGYGVAFSPDGTRLYANDNGLNSGIGTGDIVQYDLTAADIAASGVVIANTNNAFGTMQQGPDGMIYCARLDAQMHISRITAPNALGTACGYDEAGISTAPHMSTWGLANDWDHLEHASVLPDLGLQDTLICGGDVFDVDVTVEVPFEEPLYIWNTGATTPIITIDEDGMYRVEVQLSCGVVIADSMWVTFSSIDATLGADRAICEGDSVALVAPAGQGFYFWNTGARTSSIVVGDTGTYWVDVLDHIGCVVRDSIVIERYDCTCPVYVPNTVTPNGDRINDTFAVTSYCPFDRFHLAIFDRWGSSVYSSSEPEAAWSANVPAGIYVWTLDYEWADATGKRQANRNGHVTVVK